MSAGVLAACATAPPARVDTAATVATDTPFSIGGRLSAKRGTNGAAAVFSWDHAGNRDRIDLSSPFGQVYARVDGTAGRVVIERPDGATESFPDWSSMTVALLGAPIPMDDLAFWIRGTARAGVTTSVERDASGRVLVLRQQAWEIVYAYPDNAPTARPSRLLLRYPDVEPVEVRVVVDRWNEAQRTP
ncbi:MAG: outer membrane lipoprotein LolB [Betaproteobacteria bacterium]